MLLFATIGLYWNKFILKSSRKNQLIKKVSDDPQRGPSKKTNHKLGSDTESLLAKYFKKHDIIMDQRDQCRHVFERKRLLTVLC